MHGIHRWKKSKSVQGRELCGIARKMAWQEEQISGGDGMIFCSTGELHVMAGKEDPLNAAESYMVKGAVGNALGGRIL